MKAGFILANMAISAIRFSFTALPTNSYCSGAKRTWRVVSPAIIMFCCIVCMNSGDIASDITTSPYTCEVPSTACGKPAMLSFMLSGAKWCVPKMYEGFSRPLPDIFQSNCALAFSAMPIKRRIPKIFFIIFLFRVHLNIAYYFTRPPRSQYCV